MAMMSPEEFKVFITDKNSDFYEAVSSGNVKKVETKLKENADLAKIKLPNGMLPIHMAASCGHGQVVMLLYRHAENNVVLTKEQKMELFFTAIKNNIFGKATRLSFFPFPKY